jgi:DNA repair protein RecN (Recombination protein N)
VLAEACAALGAAGGVDGDLDAIAARVDALSVEAGDAASELRSYLESVEADPERLLAVEERSEALSRLKLKHGGSVDSVLAHAERCRSGIERFEGAAERTDDLERGLAAASEARERLGAELSERRRLAAGDLEDRVAEELTQLAMEEATLEVVLDPHPAGFGPNGRESVEFHVALNPGMPAGPLREVSSGGELSRLMLALSGLGSAAGAGTVVFDEIDAGVGGTTARAVGDRLRRLAADGGKQVICITHLPQVAARAQAHFSVSKRVESGETVATVERVDGDELVAEICRMLGADSADATASRHARELLAA